MIRLILILFLLTGCSQNQVKTHIGTTAGAVTGFATCQQLLNAGVELTAACTLVGGMIGSNMFYSNDMNIHTAVFVDTLNTAIDQLDKGLTIDCKKTLVDQRDKLQNEIDSFDKWAETQSDIDTSIQLEVDKALGK